MGRADAKMLRSAFDDAPVAMLVCSPAGLIMSANAAYAQLLGRGESDLEQSTIFDVTHPDDMDAARDALNALLTSERTRERHQMRVVRGDASVLHVLVATSLVERPNGKPSHLVMQVEDISEQVVLMEQLREQALHDPLTGLPNRVLLLERLGQATARARRSHAPISVLFLDLDGFKAVNDTLGHAIGDVVLRTVANRLAALLRPNDTAARLGGDEFVVLCEDTTTEQAQLVAARLREAVCAPLNPLDGVDLSLSVAIGIACSTDMTDDPDPEELLRTADNAMYVDKRHLVQVRRQRA